MSEKLSDPLILGWESDGPDVPSSLPFPSALTSSKSIESCFPLRGVSRQASYDHSTEICGQCPSLLWDAALSSAMTVIPKATWSA